MTSIPKKVNIRYKAKRCLALVLSTAMTLPFLPHSEFTHNEISEVKAAEIQKDTVYGDVNSDGKITILDMIALKSYLTEKNTKGFSVKAADLDEDGEVSAKDAVELSMYLLNSIGSFSNELNTDTDGDGLSDYVEKEILKTDHTMKDSDGDGLDDYSEVYLCGTDPLETDTGNTGIKDSLKDADEDKLTNAEEIKLGTSPSLTDTDEDGINDYDEVKKYKTDPLNADTDNDSISDNGEIILGLDPIKVKSDGITSDKERTFDQTLSADHAGLYFINTENNFYTLDISAKSAGYINEAMSVDVSAYTNYLQNDAIVGDIVDIDYADEFKIESMKISFSVPKNAERYYIFRFFEDVNTLIPVETMYDGNDIFTECSDGGTFCIIDMDSWIADSAVDQLQSTNVFLNAEQGYLAQASQDEDVEVFFIMYASSANLESVKSSVKKASQKLIDYFNKREKSIKLYYSSYNNIISLDSEKKYLDNNSSDDNISDTLDLLNSSPTNKINLSNYPIAKRLDDTWKNYGQKTSGTKYYYIINAGTNPPISATQRADFTNNPFDSDYYVWSQFAAMSDEFYYYSDGSTIIIEDYLETKSKVKKICDEGAVFNVICNKNNSDISKYKKTFFARRKRCLLS